MRSGRIPADLRPNPLALARERHPPVYDLTLSNPTQCGIPYPSELLAPLADPAGLVYEPDPRGVASAREAVAALYGPAVPADQVVLTASTSEAYALLLTLLCNPGEAVLAPVPSYPLFEHLARVTAVQVRPYRLEPEGCWRIASHDLTRGEADGEKAIIAVHPNNPTGTWLHPEDADLLAAQARRRGAAVIIDEVFLEYPLADPVPPPSLAGRLKCLTFVLGGLSKSLGLPQVKLGWIVVSGPARERRRALEGLEYLADTFLSVATPVQLALPHFLKNGQAVRQAILQRCRHNLAELRRVAAATPAVTVLPSDGGWSAVLRIPTTDGEAALVLGLLERHGVAVHPGYYFDFPRDGYLVVSLLPPPEVFAAGIARVLASIAA